MVKPIKKHEVVDFPASFLSLLSRRLNSRLLATVHDATGLNKIREARVTVCWRIGIILSYVSPFCFFGHSWEKNAVVSDIFIHFVVFMTAKLLDFQVQKAIDTTSHFVDTYLYSIISDSSEHSVNAYLGRLQKVCLPIHVLTWVTILDCNMHRTW